MSKHQTIRSLRKELRKINSVIDRKIIQGAPYPLESRRHKFIVSQLKRLVPAEQTMFGRSLGFMSMFMF